jgi:hypothetical protein
MSNVSKDTEDRSTNQAPSPDPLSYIRKRSLDRIWRSSARIACKRGMSDGTVAPGRRHPDPRDSRFRRP